MSSYGLEILDRSECESLLAGQQIGRVAVTTGRPAVLPVVFALLDGDVVFRTAPGEKLVAAVLHREVVFEVDAFDAGARQGWSVNLVGPAEEIVDHEERARVDALGLEPWAGDLRDRVVRIRAREVSGRRVGVRAS